MSFLNKVHHPKFVFPIIGIHLIVFTIASMIILKVIPSPLLTSNFNFWAWDANHYKTIALEGYKEVMLTAFFPGWPYLLKILFVNPIIASILNVILFAISIYILQKIYKSSILETFLLISVPSFMFFGLAYSESLFLILMTSYFYYVDKKNYPLIFISIMLASTVRASANIILPAMVLAEIFCSEKIDFKRLICSIGGCLSGLMIVLVIHYLGTGKWFSFIEAQKMWGHVFSIPKFPFSTWDAYLNGTGTPGLFGRALFLDSMAFLLGSACLIASTYFGIQKIKKSDNQIQISYLGLLSIIAILGYWLFTLFFKGGSLFSSNRYIFCTVFFISLFYEFRKFKFNIFQILSFFNFMLFIFSGFTENERLHNIIFYLIVTVSGVMLLGTLKFRNPHLQSIFTALFYLFFTGLQSWYWLRFLSGMWVA